MEKYSGVLVWGVFFALMAFVVFYFSRGYYLYWMIKKDPVVMQAKIVSYFPRTPNNLGKVDIVMTYSFRVNTTTYTKKNQTLNINTTDLEKYHVGKDIPIIYYRGNPEYNKIDYYSQELRH